MVRAKGARVRAPGSEPTRKTERTVVRGAQHHTWRIFSRASPRSATAVKRAAAEEQTPSGRVGRALRTGSPTRGGRGARARVRA